MAASASAEARRPRGLAVLLLAALLLLLRIGPAQAHPMPESRAWIDTRPGGLQLTLLMPLDRLEFAVGQPLSAAPRAVLPAQREALARYVLLHVGARSSGQGWQAGVPRLAVIGTDASAELQAQVDLVAPPGADSRQVDLLVDAVTHEVRTHRIQVFLRSDWSGGFFGQMPRLIGVLDGTHARLRVPLEDAARAGSPWSGLIDLLAEGMRHIAEGSDHLLFLLLLLVVAPLGTVGQRWGERRPVGDAIRQVTWVVSAFTLGHSVTLLLGSSGVWAPPAQPVEIAVALTIVVAAMHAWRPLVLQGEIAMALGFGLIHGLAFSASLSGAGLTPGQQALALGAFNLGIELMQLLLVMLVMPALVALAGWRPPLYGGLRRGLSLLAAAVALGWALERAGAGWSQALGPLMSMG